MGDVHIVQYILVSIHAFRGEGDAAAAALDPPHLRRFNPRLPGGRRRYRFRGSIRSSLFQSTPSGGKATRRFQDLLATAMGFNPRLPGGRRPIFVSGGRYGQRFQSTPSGGKATCGGVVRRWCDRCFNPRLPGGRRLNKRRSCVVTLLFQSTPSGGKATAISRAAVPCSRQIL